MPSADVIAVEVRRVDHGRRAVRHFKSDLSGTPAEYVFERSGALHMPGGAPEQHDGCAPDD